MGCVSCVCGVKLSRRSCSLASQFLLNVLMGTISPFLKIETNVNFSESVGLCLGNANIWSFTSVEIKRVDRGAVIERTVRSGQPEPAGSGKFGNGKVVRQGMFESLINS